ncbi:DUF4293 domain-containing protein [Bacteroidales bacterium OttesenSCG-928-J19]|nr:DUF4293 domain-containing protein [Bacteroidales bacterium OttesenSCG-928-J19]
MIQRIQSVYLLLVAGLMICMIFIPVVKLEVGEEVISWTQRTMYGLTALVSLCTIFLYKNRKLQVNLGFGILLLLLLSYLTLFFDFWMPHKGEASNMVFQVSIAFPAFAAVLDILAIRAIKKDEKLVRSMDRLR